MSELLEFMKMIKAQNRIDRNNLELESELEYDYQDEEELELAKKKIDELDDFIDNLYDEMYDEDGNRRTHTRYDDYDEDDSYYEFSVKDKWVKFLSKFKDLKGIFYNLFKSKNKKIKKSKFKELYDRYTLYINKLTKLLKKEKLSFSERLHITSFNY